MENNPRWIKPLWPEDVPANTAPIWNIEELQWKFIDIVEISPQSNTANTF